MSKNTIPKGSNSKSTNSRDLVTRAFNNPVIVKNEDGEYAPVGNNTEFFNIWPFFASKIYLIYSKVILNAK